ncbi:MAG: CPBP family intramembrane metalloprotease [Tenericutes bacterium]|nr:CPBP family intramembrane metalloprotease [Mycoplasmatota bacterium]
MNEFDDLFNDNPKQELITENNGIDDFDNFVDKQKHSGLLLIVYFAVTLIVSLAFQFIVSSQYPDTEVITENIVDVVEVDILVTDNTSGSTDYPYIFHITGSLVNNNDVELPVVYYLIEFFDAEGESYGVYTYKETDVAAGAIIEMDDEIETSFEFASYTYEIGFDVSDTFYTISNLLPVLICAFAFLMIDKESFKADLNDFKKKKKQYIGQIFSGFFMVYAALLVANLILELIGVLGTSENEMAIQSLFSNDPLQLFLLFLLLCVFTPIVEEVVFRKIIYTFIEPRSNYIIAIIVTGAIFGLMHVLAFGDFIQSIPYIFMGLTFGYIYYRANKNIYVTIGVHFLNNLFSYLIYFIAIVFGITI